MKYLAAIIVFTLFLTGAQARTVDCSSSNGQLQFSSWSYGGGAAPGAGMMSTKVTVTFKNQIVFERKTYFPCDDMMCGDALADPDSNISWEFDESSRVAIQDIDFEWGYHKVFATTLQLRGIDGQNMTGMDVKEHKEWILCQEHYAIYP